jgi:sugar phosphate isomerase/epimerase
MNSAGKTMAQDLTRREWLAQAPAVVGATAAKPEHPRAAFGFCLNTSTISGQQLDLVEVVEIAARAGYQAIEPWLSEVERYVQKGGNLKDLGRRIQDRGLRVESSIAFFEWIVDDAEKRRKGFEDARRAMDQVRQLGGTRIAAPPAGAIRQADLDLLRAAERYRALLDLGERFGVTPQVEFWGFSRCLSRLGEAALVAMESGHPKACILADVYHLHKGGSQRAGLRLLQGSALHVIHVNDYPAQPPREAITDAQRLYPGDGVAPLGEILRDLQAIGFRGVLSLELFNRDYWKQDAQKVARTGLEKMQAVVRQSLGESPP